MFFVLSRFVSSPVQIVQPLWEPALSEVEGFKPLNKSPGRLMING